MTISWPSLKNWLTVAASAFAVGGWAYLSTHTADGMKNAVIGGLLAGAGAVWHLYTTTPPAAKAAKLAAKLATPKSPDDTVQPK